MILNPHKRVFDVVVHDLSCVEATAPPAFSSSGRLLPRSRQTQASVSLVSIVCSVFSEGVELWVPDAEAQQMHPAQSRVEESSHTHRCRADGETCLCDAVLCWTDSFIMYDAFGSARRLLSVALWKTEHQT